MDGTTTPTTAPVLILLGPPGQARALRPAFSKKNLASCSLARVICCALQSQRAQRRERLRKLSWKRAIWSLTKSSSTSCATGWPEADCAKGVILDGFPRTTVQAEALDALLSETGQRINAAISLEVEDAEMVTRISGRFTCGGCGEGYHDTFKPTAQAGTCDKCGGTEMKRRADDTAETVGQRLEAYHAQTAPLIAYYEGKGALQTVDAMGDIARISEDLATRVAAATA